MGYVYAEIELTNGADVILAKKKQIGDEEIKKMKVTALVDSGSYTLAINENIQEYLQIPVVDKKEVQLADGKWVKCDLVAPIEIRFINRHVAACSALVLPGDSEILLGAIPLEELDVLIDPVRQRLIVNPAHPDYAVWRI